MCKQEDENECACDIMGDMVMNLFLCGRHSLEILRSWANAHKVCESKENACAEVEHNQLCEELNWKRSVQPLKGIVQRHSFFVFSHMLGTSNSDFRSHVSGQWLREFQPLCFPYLHSRRLAVPRAWVFAVNKLTTEETVTYSLFGPRPLAMSWLTCCWCIAVIACGIGLFHMARASSRPTSVQINTTKQFWLWGCSVFTALPGAHICLKCAYVFTHRRLQWIVIDCERNLQQDKGYCTKKSRCTSFKSPRTFKSGVHLFASLEKTTCHHCSIVRSLMC